MIVVARHERRMGHRGDPGGPDRPRRTPGEAIGVTEGTRTPDLQGHNLAL